MEVERKKKQGQCERMLTMKSESGSFVLIDDITSESIDHVL